MIAMASNPHSRTGKSALLVIGMHRSGTSATTGALQTLGIELGKRLYPGHREINAKGYFENRDIVDANEELLLSLGSAWDDISRKEDGWWEEHHLTPFAEKIRRYVRRDFSRSHLWAVKDPTICRLLPFWLPLLESEDIAPHFLFIIRSPHAVHQSLARRDGFSQEKSLMLWLTHYLESELASRGYPRAFMAFDSLIHDPVCEFTRIEQELGVVFPVPPASAAMSLRQFLSPTLRHHTENPLELHGTPVADLAHDVHLQLKAATVSRPSRDATINSEDFLEKLTDIMNRFPPVLVEQLSSLGRQRGKAELTVKRVMRSWSWFLGKPLRFIERLFGRDI